MDLTIDRDLSATLTTAEMGHALRALRGAAACRLFAATSLQVVALSVVCRASLLRRGHRRC